MRKVLETPAGVLEERLRRPPRQRARLQERLLLLLVLVDQLSDQRDLVVGIGLTGRLTGYSCLLTG